MKTQLLFIALLCCNFSACSSSPSLPDSDGAEPLAVGPSGPRDGKVDRVPDARTPSPDASPPSGVLAATTDGALCLLEATTGALVAYEPSTIVDLMTLPDQPGRALAAGWSEEGGGVLLEAECSEDSLFTDLVEPLGFDDTRLLYGPSPTVALGHGESTTLFVGGEGRAVFGTSSFLAVRDNSGLDIWLLERASVSPRLTQLRWEGGFREVTDQTVPIPSGACPSRLVRAAPLPLIAGNDQGNLFVMTPDGDERMRLANAVEPDACVEDVLWLDGSGEIAVLTGPAPRLHILGTTTGETLVLSGTLWHDPRPHRRIAYDPVRATLWLALSEKLEALQRRSDDGFGGAAGVEADCNAESVVLIRTATDS